MLISNSHSFIFFHVAKVAGLSLRDALQPYAQEPERFKIRRPARELHGKPNPLYAIWEASMTHMAAGEARKELGPTFDDYYKFAFVRNPWDWQVSMYHFLLKETANPRYEQVKALAGFEEFLEWVIATPNPYPRGATKFQSAMITNPAGEVIVDFVGRYETLADDFAHVCRKLAIKASLPHLNKTRHRDYRSYYNERTRKLVADYFQADIERFGYCFDPDVPTGLRTLSV